MDRERLMRMANTVRTGGKGTVRRKKKAVHKATSTDDKRLQSTLKRLGVNTIPGIEEVNLFQTDGNVVHFVNPKGEKTILEAKAILLRFLQASIAANTYVVSGPSQVQSVQELLPGIMNQIATDVSQIQRFAQTFQGANKGRQDGSAEEDKDDDDVPDLVENFEEASK